MSSPSFLLANETNYLLLQSLLESMNAIVEHQYNSKYALPLESTRLELIRFKAIRSSYKVSLSRGNALKHYVPSL